MSQALILKNSNKRMRRETKTKNKKLLFLITNGIKSTLS